MRSMQFPTAAQSVAQHPSAVRTCAHCPAKCGVEEGDDDDFKDVRVRFASSLLLSTKSGSPTRRT